jgi:GT2 family glycosyltransferase
MMPDVVVCTPTYRKFDLCHTMITSAMRGTLEPTAFLILDNSCGGFTEYLEQNGISYPDHINIITAERNEGCEPSWNIFMRIMMEHYPDALAVIVNDDIEFHADTIQLLVDDAQGDKAFDGDYKPIYVCGGIAAPNAFSLFLTHPKTLTETLGFFNENFAPAYHADNDMFYRMKLLGYDLVRVENCSASHGEGSATIKAYTPQERALHDKQFQRNSELYQLMWGGLPHEEIYTFPFNGAPMLPILLYLHKKYNL